MLVLFNKLTSQVLCWSLAFRFDKILHTKAGVKALYYVGIAANEQIKIIGEMKDEASPVAQ